MRLYHLLFYLYRKTKHPEFHTNMRFDSFLTFRSNNHSVEKCRSYDLIMRYMTSDFHVVFMIVLIWNKMNIDNTTISKMS